MPLWTTEGRAPYGEADTRAKLKEQLAAVEQARAALSTQLADLSALPDALLREAFGGTL